MARPVHFVSLNCDFSNSCSSRMGGSGRLHFKSTLAGHFRKLRYKFTYGAASAIVC